MSKFHATAESMSVDRKQNLTYEKLLEELRQKDKQIEELMIGDGEPEEEVNKSLPIVNHTFLNSFLYPFSMYMKLLISKVFIILFGVSVYLFLVNTYHTTRSCTKLYSNNTVFIFCIVFTLSCSCLLYTSDAADE